MSDRLPDQARDFTIQAVDWESAAADEARRLRFEVFVDEQQVPAEMEIDEIDPAAHHLVAYDKTGAACGTGRLYADSDDTACAHIGRMAVVWSARRSGCGSALLRSLIEEARRRGFARATLSAQTHALGFYARHGFRASGPIYDDAGIPHQRMDLEL